MIKASDNPAGELVNGTMADPLALGQWNVAAGLHVEIESGHVAKPKSTCYQNSIEYRNQYVACDRANPACAASSQAAQGPSMFAPTPVDTGRVTCDMCGTQEEGNTACCSSMQVSSEGVLDYQWRPCLYWVDPNDNRFELTDSTEKPSTVLAQILWGGLIILWCVPGVALFMHRSAVLSGRRKAGPPESTVPADASRVSIEMHPTAGATISTA